MKVCSLISSGVFACLALSSGVLANDPIEYGTDIRRCVASYAGNGSGSTWQDRPAPYKPYEGGANIEVTNGLETWFSTSTQDSEMDGFSMVFDGAGSGTAIGVPLSAPLTSSGQSKFDLYFAISEPTEYFLAGTVGENGHADSLAVVRLSLIGGSVVEQVESGPNHSATFDLSGTLQPGNYRLYAEATGRGRTGPLLLVSTGNAHCTLTFNAGVELFHPADWNRDHWVNTEDFFMFMVDFHNDNADFNHDKTTNSVDLFEFLSAFNG